MRYQILTPLLESVFASDESSAVKLCHEYGLTFFFEMDGPNYPYSEIKWVCHIRGGMIVRERLEDQVCSCGCGGVSKHKH